MNKVALAGYTKELRKRAESRKALPANGRQRSKLTWPFVMQPTSGLKGVCPSARVCFRRKTSEQKVQHTFGIAELAEFGGVLLLHMLGLGAVQALHCSLTAAVELL